MATQLDWQSCRTQTPWGQADGCKRITKGIVRYFTPSHGGYHVSDGLLDKMPEYLRTDPYTPLGWFEEDCAWCKVVISFPQYFTTDEQTQAYTTLKDWYPQLYRRLMSNGWERVNAHRM